MQSNLTICGLIRSQMNIFSSAYNLSIIIHIRINSYILHAPITYTLLLHIYIHLLYKYIKLLHTYTYYRLIHIVYNCVLHTFTSYIHLEFYVDIYQLFTSPYRIMRKKMKIKHIEQGKLCVKNV